MKNSPGCRRGFTLIEILVVITIIALLIGILLPALAQSRLNARRITSAANLRSIIQGLTTYAADYNAWLPQRAGLAGKPLDVFASTDPANPHRVLYDAAIKYGWVKATAHPVAGAVAWDDPGNMGPLSDQSSCWAFAFGYAESGGLLYDGHVGSPLKYENAKPSRPMVSDSIFRKDLFAQTSYFFAQPASNSVPRQMTPGSLSGNVSGSYLFRVNVSPGATPTGVGSPFFGYYDGAVNQIGLSALSWKRYATTQNGFRLAGPANINW